MKIVNILGELIEEMWEFPENIPNELIGHFYKTYQNSGYESFEDYMKLEYKNINCKRIFIEEIYI